MLLLTERNDNTMRNVVRVLKFFPCFFGFSQQIQTGPNRRN